MRSSTIGIIKRRPRELAARRVTLTHPDQVHTTLDALGPPRASSARYIIASRLDHKIRFPGKRQLQVSFLNEAILIEAKSVFLRFPLSTPVTMMEKQ